MKKLMQLLMMLLFISATLSLQAKDPGTTVTGKVISFEESLALEGVSVQVKGTNYNTGTQSDGTFSLTIDSPDITLIFSLQGYQTSEIKLKKDSSDYQVVLKRNDNSSTASATTDANKVYHLHIRR